MRSRRNLPVTVPVLSRSDVSIPHNGDGGMTRPVSVPTGSIVIDIRRPGPDDAVVSGLAASMERVGLLHPIIVQCFPGGMQWKLIAGRNRLEAARRLGWSEIEGRELPEMESTATAEIDGQIAEIDENLERREISAIEQAELIARRVEMVEARKQVEAQAGPLVAQVAPAMRKDGRRKGPQHEPAGIRQTARDLGMPRDKVRRSLAIAGLAPEAKAKAADLGLASNKAALLEAARAAEPAAQVAALEARAAPPKQSPDDVSLARLRAARFAATATVRYNFLAEVAGDPEALPTS